MWVFVVRWLVRSFVLDHLGELIATLAMALAALVMTVMWSLGIIAQPGGIYWLAAQAPAEVRAAHPLGAPVNATPTPIVLASPPPAAPAPGLTGLPGVPSGIVAAAERWLGVPYLWSGCGRHGVDCSCLAQNVFATMGVHIPRTTVEQWNATPRVAKDAIQVGDLVFFRGTCTGCGADPTHVGISIGGGLMIQAGDPVQVSSYTTGYFAQHYMGAGRVLQ